MAVVVEHAERATVSEADAGERVTFRELEGRARREGDLALGVVTAPSPGREEIDLAPPRERVFDMGRNRRIVILHRY